MKYFLSVPFTSRALPDGTIESTYKSEIERLIRELKARGHEVFCALEHTNWTFGGSIPPEDEFRKDLDEIESTDIMIVLLEERISAGVQLEIGYAYAKGVSIELYQIGDMAWSNTAFSKLSGNTATSVNDIPDFTDSVLVAHQ